MNNKNFPRHIYLYGIPEFCQRMFSAIARRIKRSLIVQPSDPLTHFNDGLLFAIGQAGISANRNRYDYVISLWDVDYRVFSQFGDDGIIDFLCTRLSLHKPTFIEIGTEDYGESNTRFLYQL